MRPCSRTIPYERRGPHGRWRPRDHGGGWSLRPDRRRIHGPLERTQGRVGARGFAPPRTLVLARVAAPRRVSDAPPSTAPRAIAVLDRVHEEPCDFLPPPEDGVPVRRPRLTYVLDGAARRTDEVTSEVRRPPFTVGSTAPSAGEPAPAEAPPLGGVRAWVERLARWWHSTT